MSEDQLRDYRARLSATIEAIDELAEFHALDDDDSPPAPESLPPETENSPPALESSPAEQKSASSGKNRPARSACCCRRR